MITYAIVRTLFLGLVFFSGVNFTSKVAKLSTADTGTRRRYRTFYECLGSLLACMLAAELLVMFITQQPPPGLTVGWIAGAGILGLLATVITLSSAAPGCIILYKINRDGQVSSNVSRKTATIKSTVMDVLEDLQRGKHLMALRGLENHPDFMAEALAIALDHQYWNQALNIVKRSNVSDGCRKDALQQIVLHAEPALPVAKSAAQILSGLPGGGQRIKTLQTQIVQRQTT